MTRQYRRVPWLVCALSAAWPWGGGCVVAREFAKVKLADGDKALAQQRLDVALAEFREAVKLDPHFAEGHYKLGLAYKEKGELNLAASALQEAVRLDPSNPRPIFELGEVYRILEKTTQAIRAYLMACDLDPQNFDMRFRLATCYHQAGELDKAVECYRTAVKLAPQNAAVRSNLGAALAAQGRHYEAIKAYKESLECNPGGPGQPIVLVNLATVYLNQERWETAHRTLRVAIQMDPNLSAAHERLGYTLWREQAYEAAADSYRRALELDPHNAAAQAGLGVVLMTMYLDNPEKVALRDEAVEAWHQSLELNPDQPKLRALVEKYRPKYEKPILELEG